MGKAKQVLNLVEGKDDILTLLDRLDWYSTSLGKVDLPENIMNAIIKELGKSEAEYFIDHIYPTSNEKDVAEWGKENAKSVTNILKAISKIYKAGKRHFSHVTNFK